MNKKLLLLLVATIFTIVVFAYNTVAAVEVKTVNEYLSQNPTNGQFEFSKKQPQEGTLCHVDITFSQNTTGWDYVTLSPNRTLLFSQPAQAYHGCGYSEAYFTWQSILAANLSQAGTCDSNTKKWIEKQIAFLQNQSMYAVFTDPTDKFGGAALRFMNQLQGLTDGLNAAIAEAKSSAVKWTFFDMFFWNLNPEIFDIIQAANPAPPSSASASSDIYQQHQEYLEFSKHLRDPRRMKGRESDRNRGQHCSALVRLDVPSKDNNDSGDVFFAHDTWSSYNAMLRQYKTYNFETSVAFSSYPSLISSTDDFLTTGNNLMITETTMSQLNKTLINKYVKPETIPEFMRCMFASIFSDSAKSWVENFIGENIHTKPGTLQGRWNSGTYCNEYMILDAKLISNKNLNNLLDGTFYVVDQLPYTYSVAKDMTWFLRENKYWPSYNIPFFPEVYALSGNKEVCEKYGAPSMSCYHDYSRAEIFKKHHSSVHTLSDMQSIMRYNKFLLNDPLQEIPDCKGCNPKYSPQLGIANRADLVEHNYSYGNLSAGIGESYGPFAFGDIDTKITTWRMMVAEGVNVAASIISGPTSYDKCPVFSWNTLPSYLVPSGSSVYSMSVGQPRTFDFGFQLRVSQLSYTNFWPPSSSSSGSNDFFPHPSDTMMSVENSEKIFDKNGIPCVVSYGDYLYVGTAAANESFVSKVRISDLETVGTLKVNEISSSSSFQEKQLGVFSISLDTSGIFGYVLLSNKRNTYGSQGQSKLIKIHLPTMKYAGETFTFPSQNQGGFSLSSFLGPDDTYGYVTTNKGVFTPCEIFKIEVNNGAMKQIANWTLSDSNNECIAAVRSHHRGYFVPASYDSSTSFIYKFDLDSFQLLDQLSVPPNFGEASTQVTADGSTLYLVASNNLVKIDLATFTIVDMITNVASLTTPLTIQEDEGFLYTGFSRLNFNASVLRFTMTPFAFDSRVSLPGSFSSLGAAVTITSSSSSSSSVSALSESDSNNNKNNKVIFSTSPTSSSGNLFSVILIAATPAPTFGPTPAPQTPSPHGNSNNTGGSPSSDAGKIAGIVVGAVLGTALLIGIVVFVVKKKQQDDGAVVGDAGVVEHLTTGSANSARSMDYRAVNDTAAV